MENKTSQQIGNIIVSTVANDMNKQSQGNYGINDYIEDFEGTEQELNITLIRMAAKVL